MSERDPRGPKGDRGETGETGKTGQGVGTGLRARLSRPSLTAVDALCAAGSVAALVLLGAWIANGNLNL